MISSDTLEWARDLAFIRDLLAAEARDSSAVSRMRAKAQPRTGVVVPIAFLAAEAAV